MTSQGSAPARFKRALATGNPLLVRAAAAELQRVGLADALSISLVFLQSEPASFSRAAARFHARVILESGRAPDLTQSQEALTALRGLTGVDPQAAASDLADVVEELQLVDVAERIDAWLKR